MHTEALSPSMVRSSRALYWVKSEELRPVSRSRYLVIRSLAQRKSDATHARSHPEKVEFSLSRIRVVGKLLAIGGYLGC